MSSLPDIDRDTSSARMPGFVPRSEYERLQRRVIELEDQLAEMREDVHQAQVIDPMLEAIKSSLGCPRAEALVMLALYRAFPKPVSVRKLDDAVPAHYGEDRDRGLKCIDVWICRLRRRFADVGLPEAIVTLLGRGRVLTPEAHAWLRARIEPAGVSAHQTANERRLRGLKPCSRGG